MRPQASVRLQPRVEFRERPGVEGVHAPLPVNARVHKRGLTQDPQVPAHGRSADGELVGEVTGSELAVA